MKGKVILFIVEGPSDQDALIPWIAEELRKLRIRATVKVVYGDILTEYIVQYSRNFSVTPSNVKGEVKKLIDNYLKTSTVKSDQIKMRDIEKIYYVRDTDNCFIEIGDTPTNKKNCLLKMFNFHSIELSSEKKIKFEVIFFAKNLEDVMYSNENATNEEKEKLSIEFGIESLKNREKFISTFKNSNLKTWNTYNESYSGIKTYVGRACNMNNLIDEIENKFQ